MTPRRLHSTPRDRAARSSVALVALIVCLSGLAFAARSASAYLPRTYESQLSVRPGSPERIAIDSANRIWGDEPSGFGSRLYEFNALGERLPPTVSTGGGGSMTVDHSNDDLYVPQYGAVAVYNAAGLQLSEKTITKEGHLAIAADNSFLPDHSPGPTAGRLYLTRTPVEGGAPLNIVELLGEYGESLTFPRYEEPSPQPTSTPTRSPVLRPVPSPPRTPSRSARMVNFTSPTLTGSTSSNPTVNSFAKSPAAKCL